MHECQRRTVQLLGLVQGAGRRNDRQERDRAGQRRSVESELHANYIMETLGIMFRVQRECVNLKAMMCVK